MMMMITLQATNISTSSHCIICIYQLLPSSKVLSMKFRSSQCVFALPHCHLIFINILSLYVICLMKRIKLIKLLFFMLLAMAFVRIN